MESPLRGDRDRLRRMRMWATGLLVLMAVVYAVSRSFEGAWSGFPWVMAFAEAAMVGALADWFAVTALFRHPLGLPIPHTAIVRREKVRVGKMIGRFLRRSFLSPSVVREQWREYRPLHRLVAVAADEENGKALALRVEQVAPSFLKTVEGSGAARAASEVLRDGLRKMPVGKVMGYGVQAFLKNPRRRELMAPVLARLARLVEEQSGYFISEAEKEAPFQEKRVLGALTRGVTRAFSGRAVEKAGVKLAEASRDYGHPLYDKIEESLGEAVTELDEGSETVREWEVFKDRILNDPETGAVIEKVLRSSGELLSDELLAGDENPRVVTMIREVAQGLKEKEEVLEQWEERMGEMLERLLQGHGEKVEALVTGMVARWDADQLIETLETHVGPDLQFIRINGTLIGGCVGVVLHAVGMVVWG
ncbi:MAG: DUF445 domain-containing protein [Verrucomicrobiaceae bacterium]